MTSETKPTGTKPTHRLYIVTGEGKSAHWKEIAAAWPHRDGKGFTIACDALPLSGQIVMREVKERPAADPANDQHAEQRSYHRNRR